VPPPSRFRSATRATVAFLVLGAARSAAFANPLTPPSPQAYWPHQDTSSWTYGRVELLWPGHAAAPRRADTQVSFHLQGSRDLAGGAHVQALLVDVAGTSLYTAAGCAFARQLALARPDLQSRLDGSPRPMPSSSSGLVIHDAAFLRIADDAIAAYREDTGAQSWLYITTPLAGYTFQLRLVPDLADSVFLYGTVLGTADVSTPSASFTSALRVHYEVDYGWADVRDDSGTLLGRARARTRGEMFYARDVGPVLARETFIPRWQSTGSLPPTPDSTFAELRLLTHRAGPTTTENLSWSSLKQRFR
jgi:hypothetical protein